MASGVRFVLTVTAGMIPGTVDPEFSKRWSVDGDQWERATDQGSALQLLLDTYADAQMYALKLAIDSSSGLSPNWVRVEWTWM